MDRWTALSAELRRCENELFYLGAGDSESDPRKRLIISTGDISDVDGFYALAQYAKSGADVLFVMNYPAYLSVEQDKIPVDNGFGKGYVYTTKTFSDATDQKIKKIETELESMSDTERQKLSKQISSYRSILGRYQTASVPSRSGSNPLKRGNSSLSIDLKFVFKDILSDVGFHMANKVWTEIKDEKKGQLYYCIGGINSVNPFNSDSIKNEVFVYAAYLDSMTRINGVTEGDCFRSDGSCVNRGVEAVLEQYDEVYMDFNGSMAFYDNQWRQMLSFLIANEKLKGVYVMGGVYVDEIAKTMPAVNGVLNRFCCATMNQLYHPERTASFLEDMSMQDVSLYFIANNDVIELSKDEKAVGGWLNFAVENGINTSSLEDYARCFYENNKAKPFDFYTAVALCEAMKGTLIRKIPKSFVFEGQYGSALIGTRGSTVNSTRDKYIAVSNNRSLPEELMTNLKSECEILSKLQMKRIDIFTFHFDINSRHKLQIVTDSTALGNSSYVDKQPLDKVVWFEHGSAVLIGQAGQLIDNKRLLVKNGQLIIGNPPQDPYSGKYLEQLQKDYTDETTRNVKNMQDILAYNTWRRCIDENTDIRNHQKMQIIKNSVVQWKILNDWYNGLDPLYAIKKKKSESDRNWGIMIQSIDFFGSNIGFIKFQAFVYNRESLDNGRTLEQSLSPGICFMRSAAVALLMVLIDENGDKYTILTRQSRVPAGIARFLEIPAGMMDDKSDFTGNVIKEVKEETGFQLQKEDIFCLTDWMYEGKYEGMYPSVGGCNELIKLYVWEKQFTKDEIEETKSKIDKIAYGEKKEGEFIKLKLISLDDIYKEAPDAKALSAIALYGKLNEWRIANKGKKFPYLTTQGA